MTRRSDSRDLRELRGEWTWWQSLLITGERVRHSGLTDHKEFFAEMTGAYFGTNDCFPFNGGELMVDELEIYSLMTTIWGPLRTRAERNGTSK